MNDAIWKVETGMSLRDYFAGQLLASFNYTLEVRHETIAKTAYKIADAMMAERENKNVNNTQK